jgi:arginine N-succinyltransferase
VNLIRPIETDDLDRLVELADRAGFGLTTLPRDRDLLRKRLNNSVNSFNKVTDEPGGESYLFVMENEQGTVVGTCGIVAKVGGYEPFYTYQIERSQHDSDVLDVHKEIPVLRLLEEHDGPTEIGSLYLSPEARGEGLGRLLSLSRFLFIAQFPHLFEEMVIAEMRGWIDEDGESPFWNALGRHFFDVDLPTADYLSMKDKRVIAELMPEHPIYIPLLPEQAQEVLGQVHRHTKPALNLLQKEGFEFAGMVDIFEAGPLIGSPISRLRIIRDQQKRPIRVSDGSPDAPRHLIANHPEDLMDFRVVAAALDVREDHAVVPTAVAESLELEEKDPIHHTPLHPPDPPTSNPSLGMHI